MPLSPKAAAAMALVTKANTLRPWDPATAEQRLDLTALLAQNLIGRDRRWRMEASMRNEYYSPAEAAQALKVLNEAAANRLDLTASRPNS